MDAVPSTAPATRTGVEPSPVASAPLGLTLSASQDRGASDPVDNQARRAVAEIIVAAGLGIPTDGARERAAAEEPTTPVTANARRVVGNHDHDRSRVEIRPLAIERDRRLIADPIVSGRFGRSALSMPRNRRSADRTPRATSGFGTRRRYVSPDPRRRRALIRSSNRQAGSTWHVSADAFPGLRRRGGWCSRTQGRGTSFPPTGPIAAATPELPQCKTREGS